MKASELRRGCRQGRQRRMEPLWSPAVAIGGNRWQMGRPATSLRQAKTVAVGCDGLPELVRRGSTVRVRQRASLFSLLFRPFCCLR
jgi:hypothetical protein